MLAYVLKRLLYALPTALGVTLLTFLLVYLAPGDPLNAIAPADAPEDVIAALKATYGLDRALPVRYGLWLARAVQGDLGASIASGRAVAGEVLAAASQDPVAGRCCGADRRAVGLCPRRAGGLSRRKLDRSAGQRHFRRRSQHSALLARSRADDRLLDQAAVAAGDGRRAR